MRKITKFIYSWVSNNSKLKICTMSVVYIVSFKCIKKLLVKVFREGESRWEIDKRKSNTGIKENPRKNSEITKERKRIGRIHSWKGKRRSDGYFGEVQVMKQYYGLMMALTFDADLFSFEKVEQLMDYLFVFEK